MCQVSVADSCITIFLIEMRNTPLQAFLTFNLHYDKGVSSNIATLIKSHQPCIQQSVTLTICCIEVCESQGVMAAAAGTEWVTGASDGSLAMWSQTKKRPTSVRRAHGYPRPGLAPFNSQSAASVHGQVNGQVNGQDPTADGTNGLEDDGPVGPGSVGGDAASWIGAVGVCKGTDLVVSNRALSCTLHATS